MNVLGRIVAPHFVAGIECRDGRVVWAAPIVRYMIGWDEAHVRRYVSAKGWSATRRRVRPYGQGSDTPA